MGGGKGGSSAPPPIDPGKSMGEYLFGKDFSGSYQGITDPRLQDRLISAERTYRPQYTALELADINVMASGLKGGKESRQYKELEAALAGLEAGTGGVTDEQAMALAKAGAGSPPSKGRYKFTGGQRSRRRFVENKNYDEELRAYNFKVQELAESLGGNRDAQIAAVRAEMKQLENMPDQKGLFDLLEEQSTRAGALQREQLGLQRASDVAALEEFAPQVVDAYRTADPYSTGLAEQQTAMAEDLYQRAQGLNPEQQRIADQQALQMSQRVGRVGDESSVAGQILGREQYLSGLRGQAAGMGQQAFGMNRQLAGDVGMTILGRPSSSINLGGQMLGQAQQGAAGPMGPQLFDPNVGLNMAMQQRGQDVTFAGMQAQANAAGQAGAMGAIGGIAQGIGTYAACWVAREVYGIESGKWMQFREWMLNDSPSWFRKLYLKYGERFAKFISNKPRIKSIIRNWMNTKIK